MIWDCPDGVEERHCSNRASCIGQFKCHRSVICVDITSTCDGEPDCIHGDDEYCCEISSCPSGCGCLLYSISCFKSNTTQMAGITNTSFIAVFISHFRLSSFILFTQIFPRSVLLYLPYNGLKDMCKENKIKHISMVHILNVSYNSIAVIQSDCFSNAKLNSFDISFNQIAFIRSQTFIQLSQLRFLNLSSNLIERLEAHCFKGLDKVVDLRLTNNSLYRISTEAFTGSNIKYITTEQHKICCLISSKAQICNSSMLVQHHCQFTLLTYTSATIIMISGCFMFFFCVLAVVFNAFNVGNLGGQNYRSIVINISMADILASMNLLVTCIAHFHYGSTYFEYEHYWKRHLFCNLNAIFLIAYFAISCFAAMTLAISIFEVTKYPFDSKFLKKVSPRFVSSILIICNLLIVLFCVLTIALNSFLTGYLASGLCLPFANPKTSILFTILTIGVLVITALPMFSLPIIHYKVYSTSKEVGVRSSKIKKENDITYMRQIVLSFRNHIGWLVIDIILFIVLFKRSFQDNVMIWFLSVILPINPILNSFVLTHGQIISKKLRYLCKIYKSLGEDI